MCTAKLCPNGFRCTRKLAEKNPEGGQPYSDFSSTCKGFLDMKSEPDEDGYFEYTNIKVSFTKRITCPSCNGTGTKLIIYTYIPCTNCGGTGYID